MKAKSGVISTALAVTALLSLAAGNCLAQIVTSDFMAVCDSLKTALDRRLKVGDSKLTLKKAQKRGRVIDFSFGEGLGDYPLRKGDLKWLRDTLKTMFPKQYAGCSVGEIRSRNIDIERIVTVAPTDDGIVKGDYGRSLSQGTLPDRHRRSPVSRVGEANYTRGLSGRNIALWQSHGLYFSRTAGHWTWQRACLFTTVEDLYAQSYVLPYLVPMLENAGAYVMLPRERDLNEDEYIIDAESAADYASRYHGTYSEQGKWSDDGEGFGDTLEHYGDNGNPFRLGKARKAVSGGSAEVSAEWRVRVRRKSEYAVYVSYKSSEKSTASAHYSIFHDGGKSEYTVNQKMGGGTWMYLGTFTFSPDEDAVIRLDNRRGKGFLPKGSVLSADAVKIGGGMGNISRSCSMLEENDTVSLSGVSGMPRFTEGARYFLQWAGMPASVYTPTDNCDDYRDDYTCRGLWVEHLSGGSEVNPKRPGLGIPVDLALAFHTDAGTFPNDSTVGTLAIYTYRSEGKETFPNGESRMVSRQLCDMVQTQVVEDIRAKFNPQWQRRMLRDRSYLESRTPDVPAMLLELLSHQNFADMKYGLDPKFQFAVSRAVYKGILKFLSLRYSCPYVVQPLPVEGFSAVLADEATVRLEWSDVEDELEQTADADGFILYTRMDGRGWDDGRIVKASRNKEGRLTAETPIERGHIYSYRIAAYNEGGKSFPSETLSVGVPGDWNGRKVVIVNNFTQTNGPEAFEGGKYAGFVGRIDRGTGYIRNIAYIGDMYLMERDREWQSDDCPGFGASHTDFAGTVVAGNSFDYPYVHGKPVFEAGYAFESASAEAFCGGTGLDADAIDLICGKQNEPFGPDMVSSIEEYLGSGGSMIVSGSRIGSGKPDSFTALGYRVQTDYAGSRGTVVDREGKVITFSTSPNPEVYSVESTDGISLGLSALFRGKTFLWHTESHTGAAVRYNSGSYRVVAYAFPIEAVTNEEERGGIIRDALRYLFE